MIVVASKQCLDALPRVLAGFLLRAAQGTTADGKGVRFDDGHALYRAHQASIEACRCEEGRPEPRPRWPVWARRVAKRRKPGEAGVGDTFERLAGRWGKRFIAAMKRIGADCGCRARQIRWNELHPYS